VAQLEEGPTVFAPISKDVEESEIKAGMELKLVPTEIVGDKIIYKLRKP